MSTNLDITGVGPEQFTHEQQTEVSVDVSLMNLQRPAQFSSVHRNHPLTHTHTHTRTRTHTHTHTHTLTHSSIQPECVARWLTLMAAWIQSLVLFLAVYGQKLTRLCTECIVKTYATKSQNYKKMKSFFSSKIVVENLIVHHGLCTALTYTLRWPLA